MSYLEENDVFEELRTYFSVREWNQLATTVKIRYLNIMKNHLFKLSIGLKSVAPDFMTMDRSRVTGQGKVSLPRPSEEEVQEGKDDEEWTLHLSRGHIETLAVYPSDRTLRKLPRVDYTEQEVPEHRANKALPPRFEIRQSHVPDTGLGVFYYGYSELPVGTHFGPYEGLKTDDLYCQMLRSGQIPPCQQLTFSVASQKQGDADEPRSYSLPFNKTLTQLTYTGKKAQICKMCDKSFSHLEKHQCVLTGEKPFCCNQCGKSFSKLSNLNRHQRVHTGNKPFHCEQCSKSFSQLVHLKKHQRLHTGEKPFHCKLCDKRFSRLDSLKRHQQLHTGEKPFHCKLCDGRFSQLGVLKTHQRLHTGEKPFHCQHCDKRFSQLGTLKSHQRLHTGEKPFQCKRCEKRFSQLGVLNRHQRIHTEGKHALNSLRIR